MIEAFRQSIWFPIFCIGGMCYFAYLGLNLPTKKTIKGALRFIASGSFFMMSLMIFGLLLMRNPDIPLFKVGTFIGGFSFVGLYGIGIYHFIRVKRGLEPDMSKESVSYLNRFIGYGILMILILLAIKFVL